MTEPIASPQIDDDLVQRVAAIDDRLRWLSSWTIHNANHLRQSVDGLKVGGHQASCASMSAIMAALRSMPSR